MTKCEHVHECFFKTLSVHWHHLNLLMGLLGVLMEAYSHLIEWWLYWSCRQSLSVTVKQIPYLSAVPMWHKQGRYDESVGYFQLQSQRWGWCRTPERSDETTGLGQTERGDWGPVARSLKRPFQERQMEDRGELRPRSLNSVGRTGGINQLGFESSQIIWRLSPRVPAVKSRLAFPDGSADNAQYVPACSAERRDPNGGGSLLTFPTSDMLLLLHHKLSVQTEWFIWWCCFKSAAAVNPKDQSGLSKREEESSNN